MNALITRIQDRFNRNPEYNTRLLLIALMVIASALSYFFFMHQSLRLDEAQSLWQSGRTPKGILEIVAEDVHVPLYQELLHLWRIFLLNSIAGARMLSLFWYVLSIPAIYLLGKTAYNRSIGIWAAILLTVSPFMAWFGSEIRMYTLFLFLTILNQYFFIRILKAEKGIGVWIGYAATAVLGVFTHYFYILGLLAQIVFFVLNKKLFPKGTFARLLSVAGLIVLTLIPWVLYVYFIGKAGNQDPLLPVPSTVDVFNIFAQFFTGFQTVHVNTAILSLWPLTLIFGFLGLRRNAKTAPETHYLLLCVFVPIATAFLISLLVTPLFLSRYLILTVPGLYLCLLSLIDTYSIRSATVVKALIVILMIGSLANEAHSAQTPVKENYKEITEYLNDHVDQKDTVILSAPFTLYPVEYYYRASSPLNTLPIWNQFGTGDIPAFSEDALPGEVAQLTKDTQNVWLVLSYDQGYEDSIQVYFDTHYARLYSHEFSPGLTLYEYRIRYDSDTSGNP